MRIEIPEFCFVVLIGGSSSGKTTFAQRLFNKTEILSSDAFRGMICDDENNQIVTTQAFEALYNVAHMRLKNNKLTVLDATNIQASSRKTAIECAKRFNCQTVAIVFNIKESILQERNLNRTDRTLKPQVVSRHASETRKSVKGLKKEGFRYVYEINDQQEAADAIVVRTKLACDKKDLSGPFDIIGDVHGCADELSNLLVRLGYVLVNDVYTHPQGRTAIFLGDLCDRGPNNVRVFEIVMAMQEAKTALCIIGNHDAKLNRYLRGNNVLTLHGLSETIEELKSAGEDFKNRVKQFTDSLESHYVLDNGRLVVAHAGIKEDFHGRISARVRDFCLYGDTTGETDEYGFPVRLNWASEYRGGAIVVYGHTPQVEVQMVNNTYCIDTGCVFGGKLTTFRYPEKEIVSVPANKMYAESARPLAVNDKVKTDEVLSYHDVSGKLIIDTFLTPAIMINEENTNAALEVMSRFSVEPNWLIYLPPTMSPSEVSELDEYLEYPTEAFKYYKDNGVEQVICEKKHMGSRAVIVLAKDSITAVKRFGIQEEKQGVIYTRTGRPFFTEGDYEQRIIERLAKTLSESGFWQDLNTDWVAFDTELLPWSLKAQALLQTQYAPVGRAGKESYKVSIDALQQAAQRGNTPKEVSTTVSGQNIDLNNVLETYKERAIAIDKYIDAYREYCWNVIDIDDVRIAPFHILATENNVHFDKNHVWHMEMIKKYCTSDPMFIATEYIIVDCNNPSSIDIGIKWWLDLTQGGGEGMVVKPLDFVAKNRGKVIQPAIKCRGREYLRIIYGAEYTIPEHLSRLKKRGLGKKRSLAIREFSLGLEALQRFVKQEPLYRIHQCVFGVLALESEPVDPRL